MAPSAPRVLPTSGNFLGIDSAHSNYDRSAIAIVSAPYEATVSYGHGTAKAPKAILDASHFVEFFDDEFFRELCFDCGIATLPPLNFGKRKGKSMLSHLEREVSKHLEAGKFVVTLGGEHSISTAPILAHYRHNPKISVLHFDAHSDLRDSYSGTIYSHASFMARVIEAGVPASRIVQVGIRAQCKEEYEFIRQHKLKTYFATEIRRGNHGVRWQKAVVDSLPTKDVYVTFDVDYFDPSIMPTTGTPEPDGFQWNETMEIFRQLRQSGKRIVGFDVVELSPDKHVTFPTYLTAKLVYRLLNFAFAPPLRDRTK